MRNLNGPELRLQQQILRAKRGLKNALDETERLVQRLRIRRSVVHEEAQKKIDDLVTSCNHRVTRTEIVERQQAVIVCVLCGEEV